MIFKGFCEKEGSQIVCRDVKSLVYDHGWYYVTLGNRKTEVRFSISVGDGQFVICERNWEGYAEGCGVFYGRVKVTYKPERWRKAKLIIEMNQS